MGPNEADIIRVYTKAAGSTIADVTLDSAVNAEVVVDVEAGGAVFFSGAQWHLGIEVVDLVAGGVIAVTLTPTAAMSGSLNSAPWAAQAETFAYTIPAANLGPHKGHLCRVYAYLLIGTTAASYDATFVESPLFLILP
jgi:hypothetical protein